MPKVERRSWACLVVAVVALVPAAFVAVLALFDACFGESDGTGGTGRTLREQVCRAGDGGVLPAVAVCLSGAAMVLVIVAARRGVTGSRAWLLALLPALFLVAAPLLASLLPES